MIKLSELQRLDRVSLAEIEKIIEDYEDLRMSITRDINFHGGIENYEKFIDAAFEKWGHISANDEVEQNRKEKFFAILKQMKNESVGVKNV